MTVSRLAVFLLALAGSAVAHAADLDVEVRGPDGAPIRDAVIAIHLVGAPTPAPSATGSYAIDQQNIQFHPFMTVVRVGARVSFLNHDTVRHHVYSFSPAKTFELKLEKQQQDRTVVFDKPGAVPLGCNIHDSMIAFVDVVDTPWAAKTDAAGRVTLHGLPVGSVSIDVWHPYLRTIGNHIARTVTLANTGHRESFVAALRAPPRPPAQADY